MLEVVGPCVLDELKARQHLSGVAHEHLQQRELPLREVELRLASPGLMSGRVQTQVTDAEDGWALALPPPNQRAQARHQLCERERLGQVVVRAAVETRDA